MEFMSGNMVNIEMLKEGLIAGIAVAVVSVGLILLSGQYLHDQSTGLGATGDRSSVVSEWMFRWAAVSLVFGVLAAYVFNFTTINFGWNGAQYLLLAVVLMVVLDVLAFVPIYEGKIAPFALEWVGLNGAFAVGFGVLIPKLTGN
jgi:hypothetical protein